MTSPSKNRQMLTRPLERSFSFTGINALSYRKSDNYAVINHHLKQKNNQNNTHFGSLGNVNQKNNNFSSFLQNELNRHGSTPFRKNYTTLEGTSASYTSPYRNEYSYRSGCSSYTPVYQNRFVSPYVNYNNGVTTATLNIQLKTSFPKDVHKKYSTPPLSRHASQFLSKSSERIKRSLSLRDHEMRKSSNLSKSSKISIATSETSIDSEGYEVRLSFR